MACPQCHRRSALLAALAPAIERTTPLTRQTLLGLLAIKDDEQLRHAVKGTNPSKLHHKTAPPPTPGAPTTRGLASRTEPPATAHAAGNASRETCRHDDAYPQALAQLDSAPAVLHTTCNKARLTQLLAQPTVALIGDRQHTNYGHQATWALARDLATAGITIISGLHQGIDGIAHHGALHAGGQTIAVTGSAPEIPHPRQLEHLHHRIKTRGAIASEFPPGFNPPRRWCFIASQRIIAALADTTVIVEAGERSGALLTAQVAADLGKDVAVVPGRTTDPAAQGTLALLRDGAHPIASAQDVLELMPRGRL